ncbi:hypothetical protein [Actinoallomurus liliacearum]
MTATEKEQGMRNPAFKRLEALLGGWRMEAIVDGRSMGFAHARFEWVEDAAFMRQYTYAEPAEVLDTDWAAHSPMPVTSIIGLDDSRDEFTMLYADARGVFRVYRLNVVDGVWTMYREAPGFNQRFSATFGSDGRTISGAWEASSDALDWCKDFDVSYTREA